MLCGEKRPAWPEMTCAFNGCSESVQGRLAGENVHGCMGACERERKKTSYGSFCVVQLAVIPDHLNIVQTLFDGVVFVLRQFLFGCTQIHRVLDDLRVICQSECFE